MTDLSAVAPVAREVHILHPANQEPIGLVIKVLPTSDPKVKAVQRHITNQRLAQRRLKLTAEGLEAQGVTLLCAAVTGWEWGKATDGSETTFHGEKPEFNEANLRLVLKELDWVKQQLDDELGDQAAFFTT